MVKRAIPNDDACDALVAESGRLYGRAELRALKKAAWTYAASAVSRTAERRGSLGEAPTGLGEAPTF